MKDGISGAPLPIAFPYSELIDALGVAADVSPCLIGAIKYNETGMGEGYLSEHVISADGGHGLMQLTSSYPPDWDDPTANVDYAIGHFIEPAWRYWSPTLQGGDLVRAIAASYNAGIGAAQAGHDRGDVDLYTTNHYGARALAVYEALARGDLPS